MTHSVARHLRIDIDAYDQSIRTFIAGYDEMLDQAVAAVASVRPLDLVLDLGAGTGALSERLLDRFEAPRVELWDVDQAMLGKAATRLEPFGARARYRIRSFYDPLPRADAIMASLALHHVRDLERKVELYRVIADALRPGGVFVNADVTIPTDDAGSRVSYRRWADHMVRSGIEEGAAWRHFEDWAGEDHYFSLDQELESMARAGLQPSVPWRLDPTTVTVGVKP